MSNTPDFEVVVGLSGAPNSSLLESQIKAVIDRLNKSNVSIKVGLDGNSTSKMQSDLQKALDRSDEEVKVGVTLDSSKIDKELNILAPKIEQIQNRLQGFAQNNLGGFDKASESVKELVKRFNDLSDGKFDGDIKEKSEAFRQLQDNIRLVSNELSKLSSEKVTGLDFDGQFSPSKITSIQQKITSLKAEFDRLSTSVEKTNAAATKLDDAFDNVTNARSVEEQASAYTNLQSVMHDISNQAKSMEIIPPDGQAKVEQLRLSMEKFLQTGANGTSQFSGRIRELMNELNNPNLTKGQFKQIGDEFATIRKEADLLAPAIKESSSAVDEITRKFAEMFSVAAILNQIIQVFKEMASVSGELDNALNELQIVTGASASQVDELYKSYNNLAKELSATTSSVIEASSEFLRQGKSVQETEQLIKSATVLARTGFMDTAESAELLTAALNGFRIEAMDSMSVVDKLTAVDAAAATSTKELAQALQVSSQSAQQAGIDLDTLVGYIGTVSETTRRSANTIGNDMRRLFSRLQNVKFGALFDPESGEDLSNVEATLKNYGILLRDQTGDFRDMSAVLDEIAGKWNNFTKIQKADIATQTAGQVSRESFLVLMERMQRAHELEAVALQSEGSAMEKNATAMESYQARMDNFTRSFEGLSRAMVDSDFSKGLIDFGAGALDTLTKVTETIGALPVTVGLVTAAFGTLGKNIGVLREIDASAVKLTDRFGLFKTSFSDIAESIKSTFNGIKDTIKGTFRDIEVDLPTIDVSNLVNFSDEDIVKIKDFNREINNGTPFAEAFANNLAGASVEAQALANNANAATKSTSALATATQASTAATIGMRIAMTALNVAISMGISFLIQLVAEGLTKFAQYQENLKKTFRDAVADYESAMKKVGDYDTKLEETQNRIKELIELKKQRPLNLVESAELENLQEYAHELENISIVAAAVAEDARKAMEAAAKEAIRNSDLLIPKNEISPNGTKNMFQLFGWFEETETHLDDLIKKYQEAKAKITDDDPTNDVEGFGIFTKNNLTIFKESSDALRTAIDDFEGHRDSLTEGTADWQIATDALNKMYEALMGPAELRNYQFDQIFNLEEFKVAADQIRTLGQEGQLSLAALNAPEFTPIIVKLHELGFTAQDVVDKFNQIQTDGIVGEVEALGVSLQAISELGAETAKAMEGLYSQLEATQNGFAALQGAVDQYNETGSITVEMFTSLIQDGGKWLQFLVDENGQLSANEQAYQNSVQAQIEYIAQQEMIVFQGKLANAMLSEQAGAVEALLGVYSGSGSSMETFVASMKDQISSMEGWSSLSAEVQQAIYDQLDIMAGLTQVVDENTQSINDNTEAIDTQLVTIEGLSGAYDVAKQAMSEYNEYGYITVDMLGQLLSLEPQYISLLMDENGQLNLNSQEMALATEEAGKMAAAKAWMEAVIKICEAMEAKDTETLAILAGETGNLADETMNAADKLLYLAMLEHPEYQRYFDGFMQIREGIVGAADAAGIAIGQFQALASAVGNAMSAMGSMSTASKKQITEMRKLEKEAARSSAGGGFELAESMGLSNSISSFFPGGGRSSSSSSSTSYSRPTNIFGGGSSNSARNPSFEYPSSSSSSSSSGGSRTPSSSSSRTPAQTQQELSDAQQQAKQTYDAADAALQQQEQAASAAVAAAEANVKMAEGMVEAVEAAVKATEAEIKAIQKVNKELEKKKKLLQDQLADWHTVVDYALAVLDKEIQKLQKVNEEIQKRIDLEQEKLDNIETTINYVIRMYDKEIEKIEKINDLKREEMELIQDSQDQLERATNTAVKVIDDEISRLQERIDAIIAEKEAIEDENAAIERQIELQRLLDALAAAKSQRNIRVYYADQGWVWEQDQKAIKAAQENLDQWYRDQESAANALENDPEILAIQEKINAYEKQKKAWQNVISDYLHQQDLKEARMLLGAEFEANILNMQYEQMVDFVAKQYELNDTLLQQKQTEIDSNQQIIDGYVEMRDAWANIVQNYLDSQDAYIAAQTLNHTVTMDFLVKEQAELVRMTEAKYAQSQAYIKDLEAEMEANNRMIENYENYKEEWQAITDELILAEQKLVAERLLGDQITTDILNGQAELYKETIQSNITQIEAEIAAIDREIEANNEKIDALNELKEAQQAQVEAAREALSQYQEALKQAQETEKNVMNERKQTLRDFESAFKETAQNVKQTADEMSQSIQNSMNAAQSSMAGMGSMGSMGGGAYGGGMMGGGGGSLGGSIANIGQGIGAGVPPISGGPPSSAQVGPGGYQQNGYYPYVVTQGDLIRGPGTPSGVPGFAQNLANNINNINGGNVSRMDITNAMKDQFGNTLHVPKVGEILYLPRYAEGTINAKKGAAIVDELGQELILRNPSQGRYTYMEKGDGVIPADLTKNLMEIGKYDIDGLASKLKTSIINGIGSIAQGISNTSNNVFNIVMNGVNDMNSFVSELGQYVNVHTITV